MQTPHTRRICLVSEYYYPVSNAPAARFKPLVDELSKYFDVHIYTSSLSKNLNDKKIHANRVPFPDNTRSVYYRMFLELLYAVETFFRLFTSKGDIYYITSPSFFNCISAALFCSLFGKNYVIDIRDDYPRVFFDTGLVKSESWLGKFLSKVERLLYKGSYFVVAATEGLYKNIKAVYSGEVYLLRNGFSEALFSFSDKKYSKFTLILHGNLSSFQGIDTVLELGKKLEPHSDRIQIVVIGKGSDDYKLRNNTPKTINFLGPKPHHEIPGLIQKAHIGLSLRKAGKISEDAFPVRAYEYIGVCLPILVTPLSEAGYYIENMKLGYQFNTDDVGAMIDRIKELMDNPQMYQEFIDNLKKHRHQYSRERLSTEFVQFLLKKLTA